MLKSLQWSGLEIQNGNGNGDSKTYSSVVKVNSYGKDFVICKKECVGHVQKRIETRLNVKCSEKSVINTDAKAEKNPFW